MYNDHMHDSKRILILILLVMAAGLLYYSRKLDRLEGQSVTTRPAPTATNGDCVPTFADGGGPYYLPNAPYRDVIHPPDHAGEVLVVRGHVVRADCTTPVSGAVLDIWQADETGVYPDEWYRGRVRTGINGEYMFETVIPKGYGEGTGYRPPHIHFKVYEGDREIITSQMFFPETRGTPGFDDAYIMNVVTSEENGVPVHEATHTIVLPM